MIQRDESDSGSGSSNPVATDRHDRWIASARQQFAAIAGGNSSAAFRPRSGLSQTDSLPGYTIQSEIHRGGQGIVYRGVHTSTGRAVAIKVLREGAFAGPTDRLRFEREVRVLGALHHPAVVTIHDFGAVGGSFYFTMDYIAGRPLDEFVRGPARTIRATVELFATICDAVNAAHLLGIIHRDIKPRNILITDDGRPFVLDFGLAKTVNDGDMDDARVADMTVAGQFVGSLPWASPEQIRSSEAGVDTRTDVYSLGVVLYYALTGQLPYDLSGPPQQAIAAIQSAEPISPRRRRRDIPADLETILLKCLDKNPDRRYRTAGDLAADLRALLACRPISARRDSLGYVLRKSVARYRAVFAGAVAVALLITGSLIFSAIQWQRTADQRDKALFAQKQEEAAKKAAAADAAKAGAAVEFLRTTLAWANPNVSDEKDARLSQMLEVAVRELDAGSLKDQPEVEATSRLTLAESYYGIGRRHESKKQAQLALDLLRGIHQGDHPDIARGLLSLANVQTAEAAHATARESAAQAIDMLRRIYGPNHAQVAWGLRILAAAVDDSDPEQSVRLRRESLQIHRNISGDQDEGTALAKMVLARALRHSRATTPEARQLLTEALQVLRKPDRLPRPSEAAALLELGILELFAGNFTDSENHLAEANRIARQIYGSNHPNMLAYLSPLDYVYDRLGKYEKALETCSESLQIVTELYGKDSPRYFEFRRSVASALRKLDRDAEALAAYRDVLEGLIRIGSDQNISGSNSRIMVARLILKTGGDAKEAEQLARDALAIDESILADSHQMRTHARIELGDALVVQKRFEEAESVLLEAHERYKTHRLVDPTERTNGAEHLLLLYQAWNKAEPGAGHAGKATKWQEWLTDAQGSPAKAAAGH